MPAAAAFRRASLSVVEALQGCVAAHLGAGQVAAHLVAERVTHARGLVHLRRFGGEGSEAEGGEAEGGSGQGRSLHVGSDS